jgi:serine/threonine protein kinase
VNASLSTQVSLWEGGRTSNSSTLSTDKNPFLDIKADNIMFGIKDDTVFGEFEEEELRNPCPRKEVEGRWIYTSRELGRPKRYGPPVLCDFGSTVSGEKERLGDVQPDIYRSPEVILQAPWQYKIDIWNAGCMVSVT